MCASDTPPVIVELGDRTARNPESSRNRPGGRPIAFRAGLLHSVGKKARAAAIRRGDSYVGPKTRGREKGRASEEESEGEKRSERAGRSEGERVAPEERKTQEADTRGALRGREIEGRR